MTQSVSDFSVGQSVEVHSFGNWYAGTVTKLGRTRVTVQYTTGSGTTRDKAFNLSLVRTIEGATQARKADAKVAKAAKAKVAKRVDTHAKCTAALRKLGYAKSRMQMARNATTYSMGGGYDSRLSISLAKGHESFIVTDRKRGDDDTNLTFISSALHIGNLANGAASKLDNLFGHCLQAGLLREGQDVCLYEIVVAIAELALVQDAQASA